MISLVHRLMPPDAYPTVSGSDERAEAAARSRFHYQPDITDQQWLTPRLRVQRYE
jgi:hypothetical protein